MYVTTFDPFARDFGRQFDRLTRHAFGQAGGGMPLDGVRRDGEVILRIDVPGIDPDSIEVTVDHGILIGQRQAPRKSGARTTSSSCGSARWAPSPAACGCRRT